MKDIEKFFKDKQLRSPHTGIFFGISAGAVAPVSLLDSMAVTGTVDGETSITGSDGVTYKTRRFTGNGTFTPTGDGQIQYLIVAGGGGGSSGYDAGGAGGGYRTNATGEENPNSQALDELLDVTSGTTYTVVVGAGGANSSGSAPAGYKGGNSWITGTGVPDSGDTNKILANGGGHGQRNSSWNNGQGGSGGGGRGTGAAPAGSIAHLTSPTVQGYPGSNAQVGSPARGGGGGGAGGAAASSGAQHGGAGRANAILTGSDVWYAGGGGGQGHPSTSGSGDGSAGGAPYGGNAGNPSRAPQRGVANTGGGGGSGTNSPGISNNAAETEGGSGVVIIRWQYA
jgi:hypothetical protein